MHQDNHHIINYSRVTGRSKIRLQQQDIDTGVAFLMENNDPQPHSNDELQTEP